MINCEEKVYIWLSLFNFLTFKKQKQLLALYDSPKDLWQNFSAGLKTLSTILSEQEIAQMVFSKDDQFILSYVENCQKQNIEMVSFCSPQYPKALAEIDSPPLVLYCKGNVNLLKTSCIAVVGTRRPTRYGKEVTSQFAGAFARAGLTIVSGLADGIDAVAHQSALENSGNTIAVLGSGLNEIYPSSNVSLAREIEKRGLLVSEYKPNEKPQTYYFPARNRIIAGLCNGVLITEAGEKSGTMHTKNYALDYNRNLYVVPGRITDINSKGCNLIIKNLQATMVLQPQDVLSAYGLTEKQIKQQTIQLDLTDEIVLSLIPTEGEIHYEQLLGASQLEPKVLNTTLTRLEIKGVIKKQAGNFFYK